MNLKYFMYICIMKLKFQIFGSKSSQDVDCMVFIDEIPNTEECHNLCDTFNNYITQFIGSNKPIDSNLAVIQDGFIIKTFKGDYTECNNALYFTYDLHDQHFPNQIKGKIPRDVELKLLRTCRVILSFWSRSIYRPQIKSALRGDVYEKIKVISSIDSTTIQQLGKNVQWKDYLKVMAFQLGQTIGLLEGMELYTKEDIALNFPDLEPHLMREDNVSLQVIEDYKVELMDMLKSYKFVNTKEVL